MFSPGFVEFIKQQEGLRLYPYRDQAGYPTIGYGHRIASMNTEKISEAQAEVWLEDDLLVAQGGALRCSPNLAVNQRRLDAVTDFCFNLGVGAYQHSTLRAKVQAEKWKEAGEQMNRWVYAHVHGQAVKLAGLVERRRVMAEWLVNG